MRDFRPASEDEMVIAFLQAELASPVWESAIRDGCDGFRLDDLRLITEPNIDDSDERDKRRATLGSYRGYSRNTYAFNGFPSDVEWFHTVASVAEVADMRLMDFDEARRLSGGTRIVRDAASNIGTVIVGDLNARVLLIAAELRSGAILPPLITFAHRPETVHVLLEGNTRAIAYALQDTFAPDVTVIAGYSAAAHTWCFY